MYILEDYSGRSKVITTKELALREAVKTVEEYYKCNPDDVRKLQNYREIMLQYIDPTLVGFYIDNLFWVYEAEVTDK